MAALTTFLTGAAVGGALKWVYDKSQAEGTTVMDEIKAVGGRSAESVRSFTSNARAKSSDALTVASDSVKSTATSVQEKAQSTVETVQEKVTEAKDAITLDAADLSIENYDEKTVEQLTPLLKPLSAEQLQQIRVYEVTHANRVTLLREIDSTLAAQA